MLDPAPAAELPAIPTLEVGCDFPMATLLADEANARALLDRALGHVPPAAVRVLDGISRRWLARTGNAQLAEIDAIARHINRPGAHFMSVNYEWGCTVRVGPSPDGRTARLSRTLDWMTRGLGRYIIAARVECRAGPFVALTWPGYPGVLQAMALGRFSAALNQAPMRHLGGGIYPLDWAVNRARVWRMPHPMPAQLLRRVFAAATTFDQARAILASEKIAAPAIFSLAGVTAEQTCVIERTEDDAHIIDGASCVGNHWQAPAWGGRARGLDSHGRTASMRKIGAVELDPAFPWLRAPILNKMTRLVMVADAALCRLVAQGYEDQRPATQPLVWRG